MAISTVQQQIPKGGQRLSGAQNLRSPVMRKERVGISFYLGFLKAS